MQTIHNAKFNITGSGTGPLCVSGFQNNFTITFNALSGNVPKLGLWSSVVDQETPVYYSTNRTEAVLTLTTNDGRDDHVKLCNGIGRCNINTGQCTCPHGWSADGELGPCAQYNVNASTWSGLARCPGVIDVNEVGRPKKRSLDARQNYKTRVYVSLNPVYTDDHNTSVIYYFPWIPEQARGAEFDRPHGVLFLNLTSNQSAGPIVLDQAKERLFFVDAHPYGDSFIGFADQVDNFNGSYVVWYRFSYKIFGFTMDTYVTRRKLYWTVPGGVGLDDGGIYWAYADDEVASVHSLTAAIGQVN
jgi:hypothetical protein